MRTPSFNPSRAGVTLIEVMIVAIVFAGIIGTFAMVSVTSHSSYEAASRGAAVDQQLRSALARVAAELRGLSGSMLNPDPQNPLGTNQVDFREATGVVGGNVQWGTLTRIGFEYAPGEADDGLDNDGNGIVDDGLLVLTRDVGGANQQRIVLCRGVREGRPDDPVNGADDNGNGVRDEGGFNLQRVGDVMIVRLSIEGPGLNGATIVRTGQTSVRLRNIGT